MKLLRRVPKILLYCAAGIFLLVLVAWGAAYWYLNSGLIAGRIAERLQEILGGSVAIHKADISLTGGSTLEDLRAYEAEGGDGQAPWLEIGRIGADVSALGFLRGNRPHEVAVQDAAITLRFSRDNRLLTHLPTARKTPEAVPEVRIEDSRFTLEQEGREKLEATGVNATLSGDGSSVQIQGTIDNPYWGKWTVSALLEPQTKRATLHMGAQRTHLTMHHLKSLPFVPPVVWEEVQIEGDTPVDFTLTFQPAAEPGGKPDVHYRIDLEPTNATVDVTCINLHGENASGKVRIEDKVVYLTDVNGLAAEGEVQVPDAKLDFTPREGSDLHFKIGVADVALQKLPRVSRAIERKFPGFDGRVSGQLDLNVAVRKGKATPSGSGQVVVRNLKKGRISLGGKLSMKFKIDEKGIHVGWAPGAADSPAFALAAFGAAALVAPPDPAADNVLSWTADVPNAVVRGVGLLTRKAVDATFAGLSRLTGTRKPPPKPAAATNYADLDLKLEDINLANVVTALKVALPFSLEGTLSIQAHIGLPIDTPGELQAYRVRGSATLPRLVLAGLEMTDVRAAVRFEQGVLDLTELTGRFPAPRAGLSGGSFRGSARLEVQPVGKLSADLEVEDLPLDRILTLLPGMARGAAGVLSGKVSAHVPADRLRDLAAWEGAASLHSPRLRAYGQNLADASARLNLARGRATLEEFQGRLGNRPAAASGQVDLKAPYPCTARASLDGVDLGHLDELASNFRPPMPLSGTLRIDANLEGTLQPLALHASGSARARELGVEGLTVDSLAFDWVSDPKEFLLRSLKAHLYGGDVTGSVTVPVGEGAEGKADLRLADVDAQALGKSVPAVPVRLEGKVSGSIHGKLSAAAPGKPRALSAQIELSAPQLRVQGIPTQKVSGSVDYQPGGTAKYRLEGESLGGRFKLEGKLPPRPAAPPEPPPAPVRPAAFRPDEPPPGEADGRLVVENARLGQLWEVYHLQDLLGPLHGVISLDLPFRHVGPERRPVGQGKFRLRDLRWSGEELAQRIQGDVRLRAEGLEFRDVTGSLGRGDIRANFLVPLGERTIGWFNIALSGVDAARLLLPWPALARNVQGPVDANLRGRLGAEWTGGGTVALGHGRVFGIEVNEWRLPLQFAFSPRQGGGEVSVRDSGAAVATGRAAGQAEFSFGTGARADGHLRFYDLDLRALAGSAGDVSSFASGRLSGRFDFAGTEVYSANDLSGTLTATLSQSQVLQLPVLRQLTPYLRLGMSTSSFQTGRLEARLAQGAFRIQRFSLEGGLLQLLIEGTVTLDGRLDLDVHARTGNAVALPAGLRILGLRLPIAGPIPASLITEASFLLARSTVHLRVTGSIRNPVVQVEPLELLTQEAVRYFLTRAILPSP